MMTDHKIATYDIPICGEFPDVFLLFDITVHSLVISFQQQPFALSELPRRYVPSLVTKYVRV